jgi:hypothetical protein
MNVLYLYNATQTYTNTVFEHISAFHKYSRYRSFYCHQDPLHGINVDLVRFDAIVIHYSLRLPFDQIHESTSERLAEYRGLKALFIQDEYDFTYRTWHWIKRLGITLVFTVVPEAGMARVYPPAEFPGVRFTSCLTGYAPDGLPLAAPAVPPSARSIVIGYRGRRLPARYGQLGLEKVAVGRMVKEYCAAHGIPHDIAWSEEDRIYGEKWYEFMASCRAMLGSESGSNVFDWDGTLKSNLDRYVKEHHGMPAADPSALISSLEIPGLMNQVSPRIFEAIAFRTALVLFEGAYSGVVEPGRHFIPLKKDGSNLDDVARQLEDRDLVDQMTERAFADVIASGHYSYQSFVRMTDDEIEHALPATSSIERARASGPSTPSPISTSPIRTLLPEPPPSLLWRMLTAVWFLVPERNRAFFTPRLRAIFRMPPK